MLEFLLGAFVGAAIEEDTINSRLSNVSEPKLLSYLDRLADRISYFNNRMKEIKAGNIMVTGKYGIDDWNQSISEANYKIRKLESKLGKTTAAKAMKIKTEIDILKERKEWYEEQIEMLKIDIDEALKNRREMETLYYATAGFNYYANGDITMKDVKELEEKRRKEAE